MPDREISEEEDRHIPFTLRDRRRIDRLDRAIFGYADESGVWVPGLLQNTADGVAAIRTIRRLVFVIVGAALINVLHLAGMLDAIKAVVTGGK